MDYKKINKKGASSLTGLVVGLIIVITTFTGLFLWLQFNAEQAGVSVDPRYNDTFNKLDEAQQGIQNNTNQMMSAFGNITESSNGFIAAWNGMKGLASALKLPYTFVDSTQKVYEATIFDTNIIPYWLTTLVRAGMLIFVILLLYAILKGEPGKM